MFLVQMKFMKIRIYFLEAVLNYYIGKFYLILNKRFKAKKKKKKRRIF